MVELNSITTSNSHNTSLLVDVPLIKICLFAGAG